MKMIGTMSLLLTRSLLTLNKKRGETLVVDVQTEIEFYRSNQAGADA
jgi:hypothetical protein